MKISQKAIDMIIFFEVSSIAYYEKFLQSPTWPKGESGITIGIGYDLGYNTKQQIENDWGSKVSGEDLIKLQSVAGLKGETAKNALVSDIKAIKIPYEAAESVFLDKSIKRFAALTKQAYPGVDELLPDAIGALISLIYNRGSSLSGDRRIEMSVIKNLVPEKDYSGIADQIIKMKRLWVNMQGLLNRRDKEANLVRNAVREYSQSELVEV